MTDDIPLPIPSYQETLINSNERNINGLPNIDNEDFRGEISVLDFSERNPFGEISV